MKKTVTTILSFALALIMVSSLGSGVSYADGKKKYKKVRVRDVVIMDCDAIGMAAGFINFDASFDPTTDPKLAEFPAASCAASFASLLNAGFKPQDFGAYSPGFGASFTRQTFVRNRTVRVPKDDKDDDDDDDDDDN